MKSALNYVGIAIRLKALLAEKIISFREVKELIEKKKVIEAWLKR